MDRINKKGRSGLLEPEAATETDNLNLYTTSKVMRQVGRRAGFSHISEPLVIVMAEICEAYNDQ